MITDLGDRGDGIAAFEGMPVFVPGAGPGDRVRVRLAERTAHGFASQILELVVPAPDRAPPRCPHYGPCGGCSVQHIADPVYREWKQRRVADALGRRGLDPSVVEPLVATPPRSRRRATFAARRTGGGVVIGFNEAGSHRIVDLEACAVLSPELVGLLPRLRELLAGVLDRDAAADVAATRLPDGLDVTLYLSDEPGLDRREALAAFAEEADLARLSVATGDPRSARPEPVAVRRPPVVTSGGIPVAVPAATFLQPSDEGEAALAGLVAGALAEAGVMEGLVADLFCGLGTLTLPWLAGGEGRRLLAVDHDGPAVAALEAAVRAAGLGPRVATRSRDLHRDPVAAGELAACRAVVFDPPRAGARDQAAEIAASAVPDVVAVSCDPASFARDAGLLVEGGYTLRRVVPVDQFLWSTHVELVARFSRPGPR